jgi:hypothetical protein
VPALWYLCGGSMVLSIWYLYGFSMVFSIWYCTMFLWCFQWYLYMYGAYHRMVRTIRYICGGYMVLIWGLGVS